MSRARSAGPREGSGPADAAAGPNAAEPSAAGPGDPGRGGTGSASVVDTSPPSGPPPAGLAAPLAFPMPPFFGERWRGPAGPASPAVLGAAAASGLLAAETVPQGSPGLGLLVLAAGWALLGTLVRRHARPGRQAPAVRRARLGWGALAVGFVAVATLRDAGWLVALCLLAAVACGSLALAGPTFRLPSATSVLVPATFRALPWAARGVGRVGRGGLRTVAAMAACAALLAVFTPLLAGSDAAFARAVGTLLPVVDPASAVRTIWLVIFGVMGMLGAAFLLVAPAEPRPPSEPSPPRLRPIEWALPLGGLAALFAAYVAVQVATLLAGDAYVQETTGVTYAEYARTGFWQLLAVGVLALGVILAGQRLAPPGRGRILLAALAVLTLAIVVTATGRMWLYQQVYGFTVLRLVVLACEVWLGAAFVLVLVAVLRCRRPRGIVEAGAVMFLALALLDPERFVAEHDVDRWAATGRIDTAYLLTLSSDAAPAVARLPESVVARCELARMVSPEEPDWRSLNASRATAAPLADGPPCRLS